jgi:ribosomal protein S18 acetylase RimI-like enzyme
MQIEIKNYNPQSVPPVKLIDLLIKKYGKNKNFDYFLRDYKIAFTFCAKNIKFNPIAIYINGKMEAHIALIVDSRLKANTAFFGFFESPDDSIIFDLLWNNLFMFAKGIGVNLIKGPINASIWYQYRVIKSSDGSDYFKAETVSELYYYNLLKSKNPSMEIIYYSAYRENFSAILNAGKKPYEKMGESGFSIQELKNASGNDLKNIYLMSKKIFSDSWQYTEMSEEDFFSLYSKERVKFSIDKLYLLYKGDEVIGFCSVIKEDNFTFIFKTIGILPEYQGLGLGGAFAYKIHLDAQNEGIKKVIYALVREDNNIKKNFPKDDAVIFREYSAFEFKV